MMNPSNSIVFLALGIAAALFMVNWLLWGLTYARDFRLPSRMTPLGSEDLLIASVLDRFAGSSRGVNADSGNSNDPDHGGFKHVA
jgi:hypothetical protein